MLNIENLKAKIEDKEILKGLNLNINPGEVHAIMGPNGSGKSTLSNILSGKKGHEINGNVSFEGENLLDLETEERAHKGIFLAFQYPLEIPGVNTNTFLKTSDPCSQLFSLGKIFFFVFCFFVFKPKSNDL